MTLDSPETTPGESTDTSRGHFWLYGLLLFASGFVLGLFGAFISAIALSIGGIEIPVGLILMFATLFSSLRMVIHYFVLRRAGVVMLVGWLSATIMLALPGPGGDVAIPSNPIAMIYLFGGVIIGTACVNVPSRLRQKPNLVTTTAADESDSGQGGERA